MTQRGRIGQDDTSAVVAVVSLCDLCDLSKGSERARDVLNIEGRDAARPSIRIDLVL
jgi:hypothetical protein